MLEMFKQLFGAVAVTASAASNVAKAADYHSRAYEKTSLLSAAAKFKEQKESFQVSQEDIDALLA